MSVDSGMADASLREAIDEIMSVPGTWVDRLGRLVEWKKAHMGLRGFRATFYDNVSPSPHEEVEMKAREIFLMERACANGDCREVDEPL